MNKINVVNYIDNKRYSVKEAIAYYKLTFDEIRNIKRKISLYEFESYLKCNFILHQFTENILDFAECDNIAMCEFYWDITIRDIIAYGDMLYMKLYLKKDVVTEIDIANELNIIMRLYSPQNVVETIYILKKNLLEMGSLSDKNVIK